MEMIHAKAQGVLDEIRQNSFTPPPVISKKPSCQICNGKGCVWVEKEGYPFVAKCECRRRKDAIQAIQDSGMPNQYMAATLRQGAPKSWVPTSQSEKHAYQAAQEFFQAVIHWKTKGGLAPWLELSGDVGVGKTMLACAAFGDLIRVGIHNAHFCQMTLIMNAISSAISIGQSEAEVLFPAQHAEITILDDLNPSQVQRKEQFAEKAGRILLYRYNKNRPTIITTNDSESKLRELLGSPIISRITENGAWVQIDGDDRRAKAEEGEI